MCHLLYHVPVCVWDIYDGDYNMQEAACMRTYRNFYSMSIYIYSTQSNVYIIYIYVCVLLYVMYMLKLEFEVGDCVCGEPQSAEQ